MAIIDKIIRSKTFYIVISCIASVILWVYVASYENTTQTVTLSGLEVLLSEQRGRLWTYVIRGGREETEAHFRGAEPVFFEILKLSLEEIFISETEVAGYDVRKFILE